MHKTTEQRSPEINGRSPGLMLQVPPEQKVVIVESEMTGVSHKAHGCQEDGEECSRSLPSRDGAIDRAFLWA